MICPTCGAEEENLYRYCETCGASLNSTDPVGSAPALNNAISSAPAEAVTIATATNLCKCGAGPNERDDQGYCEVCGRHVGASLTQVTNGDHKEQEEDAFIAAVTDRGKRHKTNQDDFAFKTADINGTRYVAVAVCDGLSSSSAAEAASSTAAAKAAASLVESASTTDSAEHEQVMRAAIIAAHNSVCDIPFMPVPGKDGPATTIVAALITDKRAVIGWVGDSRAYLVHKTRACQLSHDHSWINLVVDAGKMSEDEAEKAPEAHASTQCLGPIVDENGATNEAPEPGVLTVEIPDESLLLLCSDGLWNYAPREADIAECVQSCPSSNSALLLARHLIEFAISAGGRDNITSFVYRPSLAV